MSHNLRCFLDMDGVLSDFQSHICEMFGHRWEDISERWPPGTYHTHDVLGVSEEEMWSRTLGVDYWESMPKTDECDLVLTLAATVFGQENVAILTSPSRDPLCAAGKILWFHKHHPEWTRSLMIGSRKHLIANPNCVLIDDWDVNVQTWRTRGGMAILVPRLWNAEHANRHAASDVIREAFIELSRKIKREDEMMRRAGF